MIEANPLSNTLRADEPYDKQTNPRLICDKWNGMSKVEISSKCKTSFGGEYVSGIFKSVTLFTDKLLVGSSFADDTTLPSNNSKR